MMRKSFDGDEEIIWWRSWNHLMMASKLMMARNVFDDGEQGIWWWGKKRVWYNDPINRMIQRYHDITISRQWTMTSLDTYNESIQDGIQRQWQAYHIEYSIQRQWRYEKTIKVQARSDCTWESNAYQSKLMHRIISNAHYTNQCIWFLHKRILD